MVLDTKPLILGIGEYHETEDGAKVKSSLKRFTETLLPLLKGEQPNVPWRTDFLYEYFWERSLPQVPSLFGLRTERYS